MVAAISTNKTAPKMHESWMLTGSGFAASTTFVLTIKFPSSTSYPKVTSDGAGGWTYTCVSPEAGAITVEARPSTEHTGGTTATATLGTITTSRADS